MILHARNQYIQYCFPIGMFSGAYLFVLLPYHTPPRLLHPIGNVAAVVQCAQAVTVKYFFCCYITEMGGANLSYICH